MTTAAQSTKPIRAVFSDMDGTLLNLEHHVSEYTIQVLAKLKDKGVFFILCTGRPYADVFATIRKCGLRPDFIVTSNGGRIHNDAFELVTAHDLDPAIVAEIVRIDHTPDAEGNLLPVEGREAVPGAEKKFTTNIYSKDEWWTDDALPEMIAAYDESFKCVDMGAAFKELTASELGGVHEAFFLGEPADLANLERHMSRAYAGTLRCSYSLPYLLDCCPAAVTKGNAVREVCRMLGLGIDEVACFGDGMNDQPMLEVAGHAFLMGNAQPALKAAIPHGQVIGTNADDSVAKKLEELLL